MPPEQHRGEGQAPGVPPDRARRDLRWLLQAHPIVDDAVRDGVHWMGSAALAHLRKRYAARIDGIADAMLVPAQAQRRSGRYFEALVTALAEADPNTTLVAHDHQVQDEQRTLGAFDLIIRDRASDATSHWELAFKQYLHRSGDAADPKSWVGPRGRDRLDKKYDYMQRHQLQLGKTDAGRAALGEFGLSKAVPRGVMAGRLFVHRTDYPPQQPVLPQICSPNVTFGWWMTATEVTALAGQTDQHGQYCQYGRQWRVLPPYYAVAPLNADDVRVLKTPNWPDIQAQVRAGAPCLLAEIDGEREISRGWIVAD